MDKEPLTPEDQRAMMIHDIIFMRGNSGYPKSQIVIGLAFRYRPELVALAEECLGVVRNSDGDEDKAKNNLVKRFALKYNPELMDLVEETLDKLEKDPLAAAKLLEMDGTDDKQKKEGGTMVAKQKQPETETELVDTSWIEAGADGWVASILKKCMAGQASVLGKFSEDEKRVANGFACRLMVGKIENREFYECEDGGIFNLYFSSQGVQGKPPEVPIRNIVCIDSDTLFELIMPDWERVRVSTPRGDVQGLEAVLAIIDDGGRDKLLAQLRPRMSIGEALANGKILFGGDKPDVDSEMWSRLSGAVFMDLAYPIAVDYLISVAKGQRSK